MIQITLWIILGIGIQILINQLLITEKFLPLPGFEPVMFINQISCLFFCLYVLILIYCSNIIFIVWFIFRRFLFIVLWFEIFFRHDMRPIELSWLGITVTLSHLCLLPPLQPSAVDCRTLGVCGSCSWTYRPGWEGSKGIGPWIDPRKKSRSSDRDDKIHLKLFKKFSNKLKNIYLVTIIKKYSNHPNTGHVRFSNGLN